MFFLFKSCSDFVTSVFAVIVLCINNMKYAFCSSVADQNECLFLLSHGVFFTINYKLLQHYY